MKLHTDQLIDDVRSLARTELVKDAFRQRVEAARLLVSRPDKPEEVGVTRLAALLGHALQTVRYYVRTGVTPSRDPVATLASLPILDKQTLADRFAELIASPVAAGEIEVSRTGGSTGIPVSHLKSLDEAWPADQARFGRLLSDFGVSEGAEVVDVAPRRYLHDGRTPLHPLLTASFAPFITYYWRPRGIDFRRSDVVEDFCRVLGRPRIEFLYGAPSRIEPLIKFCRMNGYRLRLKAVLLTFEQLLPNARTAFEEYFQCPVISVYGTSETGICGWECAQGTLHLEQDFVHVELLPQTSGSSNSNEKLRRIVATPLLSSVMPLLRYDTGDLAVPARQPCSCGRGGIELQGIEGRASVSFLDASRAAHPPWRLMGELDLAGLTNYQVTQQTLGEVRVNLGPGPTNESLRMLEGALARAKRYYPMFQLSAIRGQFVLSPSGKRNPFVSQLPETLRTNV